MAFFIYIKYLKIKLMRYFLVYLLLHNVFCFSQDNNTAVNQKNYYGINNYFYKEPIKDKLGESQINVFMLTDSIATVVTYYRFILESNDSLKHQIKYPLGKIYIKKIPYKKNDQILEMEHDLYKYFILANNDTIFGYRNDDLLKQNIFDVFKQISNDDLNDILTLQ